MTQEFHLSVTPIRDNDYLVRTEHVAPNVPLAEEQVTWYVDDWLTEASLLMGDPVMGLLRSNNFFSNGASSQVNQLTSKSTSNEPPANLVAFGQRLFNALFQGTIRDSWMMAQGIAQHEQHRLRFRLGLKGAKLHRLPWEVLYAGDRPLATGTDVIFSRYHSSFSVLKSHLTPFRGISPNQPLKILLVLSAPNDQDVLALKQEAEQLQQELQTVAENGSQASAIELTILEQPGREDLTQALEHNHFQVLHYAGHSDLGAGGGSLYLVNKKTGLTEVMSGEDLAGLLVNNGIRMAVFNSCRGVYTATGGQSTEGNLAESLVRRGIPAVLAMAERIPDNVALNLSRLFYRNLKQAYPLDLSLSRTRQGLISSYGSDKLYWALPILYLHPEFDGFLQPSSNPPSSVVQASFMPSYTDFYASSDLLSFAVDEPITTPERSKWQFEEPDLVLDERSLNEEKLPDFDALEFDDPDPPEEEQIARLVHELSHSPTILEPEEPLPASQEENLLPNRQHNGRLPYLQLDQSTHTSTPSTVKSNGSQAPIPTSIQLPPRPGSKPADTQVYSELEAVLADMGTLTDEIASSNRAVQQNPNSAEAYTNLGWALYQQGYLTEAISAYNQAIRLNPSHANAFNRLGLAFFQQGKVDEAVRAYSQAVRLDPTMTEASTNLRNALGQDPPTASIAPINPTLSQSATAQPKRTIKPRVWLWSSLGAIALAALLTGWFYRETVIKLFSPGSNSSSSALPTSPDADSSSFLKNLPPESLAILAQQQLQQGKLNEAQATIEELLKNPNGSQATDQVLQSVPAQFADQPMIAFLQGRLIWKRWMAGDKSATIEAARQLWDKSAQAEPSATKYNAIGFAFYSEGKADRAEQAWLTALRSVDGTPNGQMSNNSLNHLDTLTARAGLALAAIKIAEQKPIDQQGTLQESALDQRKAVLEGNRDAFRPEALRQNWMWSETAIRDWEKLLKL